MYFALIELNIAPASMISKFSKMARQEVYRVLNELEEKGLVERTITMPASFKAIPLEDCLSLLIEKHKEKLGEIQMLAKKVSREHKKMQTPKIDGESQYILIQKKGKYLKKATSLVNNASENIDVITTPKRFLLLTYFLKAEIDAALNRGVTIRVLTEPIHDLKALRRPIKKIMQNPNFLVKNIQAPPSAILWIIDNKEVTLVTSTSNDLNESSTLWTNNEVLTRIIKEHFELYWSKV